MIMAICIALLVASVFGLPVFVFICIAAILLRLILKAAETADSPENDRKHKH